jgi:hypothetical protein
MTLRTSDGKLVRVHKHGTEEARLTVEQIGGPVLATVILGRNGVTQIVNALRDASGLTGVVSEPDYVSLKGTPAD